MDDTRYPYAPQDAPENWDYLLEKALRYVRLGPERYRVKDALERPSTACDEEDLAWIQSGMEQIVKGHGYRPDDPFVGLRIWGFYRLLATLHFRCEKQSAQFHGETILDTMHMRHVVHSWPTILYNCVENEYSKRSAQ
ncbi:MAG: hypothetical protein KAI66_26015 [Lentisphaeria bacterium]|nr:hypothetical protein [Lentisphaeria bacterium]